MSRQRFIRFHTLENMDNFFRDSKSEELVFKAYPVSGFPERFRYDSSGKVVSSLEDGSRFEAWKTFTIMFFSVILKVIQTRNTLTWSCGSQNIFE